ncbi:MAG: dTMP kinase [Candidatus Binataceae bacterium]|nr:dTMP kinase [Candidatus Binataceae bacterium]
MASGAFITLEGVEGSGKTTQSRLLAEWLKAAGHRVTVTHEPGGTRAGQAIRAIFLDPGVSLEVAAELMLVLADRAQHVREKLRPALDSGEIVISDRYADSTVAYQGYGRGFDLNLLRELNRLATDNIMPDLTIVLDCKVATGLTRIHDRMNRAGDTVLDRFEGQAADFHGRVRQGFLEIAQQEPQRVSIVNAEEPLERVTAQIRQRVDRLLAGR